MDRVLICEQCHSQNAPAETPENRLGYTSHFTSVENKVYTTACSHSPLFLSLNLFAIKTHQKCQGRKLIFHPFSLTSPPAQKSYFLHNTKQHFFPTASHSNTVTTWAQTVFSSVLATADKTPYKQYRSTGITCSI